jgi:hypothetical protein
VCVISYIWVGLVKSPWSSLETIRTYICTYLTSKTSIYMKNYFFCVVWHLPAHDRINPNWCRTMSEGVVRHNNNLSRKWNFLRFGKKVSNVSTRFMSFGHLVFVVSGRGSNLGSSYFVHFLIAHPLSHMGIEPRIFWSRYGAGLPDFSVSKHTKTGENITKWSQTIPNGLKWNKLAVKYSKGVLQ